jgi:hypothetical protein
MLLWGVGTWRQSETAREQACVNEIQQFYFTGQGGETRQQLVAASLLALKQCSARFARLPPVPTTTTVLP